MDKMTIRIEMKDHTIHLLDAINIEFNSDIIAIQLTDNSFMHLMDKDLLEIRIKYKDLETTIPSNRTMMDI